MNMNLNVKTVIINVGTPSATTLALLSALRYTNWSAVIIDCTPQNDKAYFLSLIKKYPFEYREMPLDIHGRTLDKIFRETNCDYILLLDSDAELLTDDFFMDAVQFIEDDDCFGVGYTHGPCPMSEGSMRGWKYLYYQERMYIPCTMLKVSAIRKALDAGKSFEARKHYNDFPIPFLARLCYYRFFFRFFQRHEFVLSLPFRRSVFLGGGGYKPSMIYYDTGADVYCYLRYQKGLHFVGYPMKYSEQCFAHYHGMTRRLLDGNDKNSTSFEDVASLIERRLKDEYGFSVDEWHINSN